MFPNFSLHSCNYGIKWMCGVDTPPTSPLNPMLTPGIETEKTENTSLKLLHQTTRTERCLWNGEGALGHKYKNTAVITIHGEVDIG